MLEISDIVEIAIGAGQKILDVYYSEDAGIRIKSDDSPLTKADLASHHHICDALRVLSPEIPVLSEESTSIDFATRRSWTKYWLIDPLDGTREFIAKRDEFTVNIALIENNLPTLGVIYVPVTGVTYFAQKGSGAFKQRTGESAERIQVSRVGFQGARPELTVVMSRHSGKSKVSRLLEPLDGAYKKANIGSSLKMCLVAEGKADFYPRLGPTSEWDTAAAQVIVEEAGGVLWDRTFNRMRYNTKESLLNDYFYVIGDLSVDWRKWCLFGEV